jgi:hypothetical protein
VSQDREIAILKGLLDRPIAFHRVFMTITGYAAAAVFLSQAFYWSSRTTEDDGSFYKTQTDWEAETGLHRYEQESARKKLRGLGILEEDLRGVPCKLYFRVDLKVLADLIAGSQPPSLRKPSNLDSGKPTNSSSTETTPETTAETTSPPIAPQRKRKRRTIEYPEAFESFWKALPDAARACDKQKAFTLWTEALEAGTTAEEIMAGLGRWLTSKRWAEGYITNATTWLHQQRWKLNPEQAGAAKTGRPHIPANNFEGVAAGEIRL